MPMEEHSAEIYQLHEGHSAPALKHLEKCRDLQIDYPPLHYYFAEALGLQGKLKEARDEYRTYLQGDTEAGLANAASNQIAKINDLIGKSDEPEPEKNTLWIKGHFDPPLENAPK